MNRRNFLFGAAATLVAAPAIVRVASIMPVKALPLAVLDYTGWTITVVGYDEGLRVVKAVYNVVPYEVSPGCYEDPWVSAEPYSLGEVVRAS